MNRQDHELPNKFSLRCAVSFAAAIALMTAGCSGDSGTSTPKSKPAGDEKAATKSAAPTGDPGSVMGKVSFTGEPPAARGIRMGADPYCEKANEGSAKRRDVVVGAGGGLAGVFVYVKDGLGSVEYEAPTEAVVIDQHHCGYVPKVIGAQVGQPIEIRNSDETLHNVHALPKNSKGFNIGMPRKDMTAVRKFASPEILVRIKCDVHPWMESFVGVTEHPFFAVTGEDGSFNISGLPPGDYTLEAVHPKLGNREAKISVSPGGKAETSFTFARAG